MKKDRTQKAGRTGSIRPGFAQGSRLHGKGRGGVGRAVEKAMAYDVFRRVRPQRV